MTTITKMLIALGTTNIIKAQTDNKQILDDIEKEILYYHQLWNIFSKDSLISKINQQGYGKIDEDTLQVIQLSKTYSQHTHGMFDITTYPYNQIWKQAIKSKTLPEIKHMDIGYQHIDIQDHTLYLNKQKIDLGGIVKGYLLDKVKEQLLQHNIHQATINLGGEICVIGKDIISIQNPFQPKKDNKDIQPVLKLNIKNQCVVTSGTYEQESYIEGKHISHIIHPQTGLPIDSDLQSITLVGTCGSQLDAYATALFSMNLDEGIALLERFHIGAIMILKDGQIFITKHLEKQVIQEVI